MIPRVLIIAGSDSSGGAGLEADQKVAAAHGCYAATATTALTAQNTLGVRDIHQIPPAFVRSQIDAVCEDVGVDVVKTGMLGSAETIEAIAAGLRAHDIKKLVVDPVMVATTGASLLPDEAITSLQAHLIPLATVLTPNAPEALRLLRSSSSTDEEAVTIKSATDLGYVANKLRLQLGSKWVLVKGGHVPLRKRDYQAAETDEEREVVVDVLVGSDDGGEARTVVLETEYLRSDNTHGTGCSLASAIACNIARGMDVPAAVKAACRYVEAGIKTAPALGKGNGPLNHFHSTYTLPFAPGRFIEYLLERPDVAPVWHRFVHHPFVQALGKGTLPRESFKGYLVQDYLYLIQFARANALASYKSKNMKDISAGATIVLHIEREMRLHVDYCKTFGLSEEEMAATEEHNTCTAYSRYLLETGQSGDWLGLQTALAPCLLGYGMIAKRLHAEHHDTREGNAYWKWVENYVADDYVGAVRTGSALLERHAATLSPARIDELADIFIRATKLEIAFWEMFPST